MEANIVAAFDILHKYRICHGDMRAANVLVKPDNSVVLIDFEESILNADEVMLLEEKDEVRHMLQVSKTRSV